jgi:hypothetical protein
MSILLRAAKHPISVCIVLAALIATSALFASRIPASAFGLPEVGSYGHPRFAVDPTWPHELPNNWIIGQVGGLSVDKENDIWVYQTNLYVVVTPHIIRSAPAQLVPAPQATP